MFCSECGKPIEKNQRFCAECGSPIERATTPAEASTGNETTPSTAQVDPSVFGASSSTTKDQPPIASAQLRKDTASLQSEPANPSGSPDDTRRRNPMPKINHSKVLWSRIAVLSLIVALAGTAFYRFYASQTTVPDVEIARSIQAKYAADPAIRRCTIGVRSENGIVTIAGYVDNAADRSTASNIALQQHGVKTVIDDLLLFPVISMFGGTQVQTAAQSPSGSASILKADLPGNPPSSLTGTMPISFGVGSQPTGWLLMAQTFGSATIAAALSPNSESPMV